MQHLSSQVAAKQTIARTVISALLTNADSAARDLGALLFPDGVPPDVNLIKLIQALAGLVARDTEALAALDLLVSREHAEDGQAREGRDVLVVEIRTGIGVARKAVESAHGDKAAKTCGLAGRTPENGEQLVQAARDIASKLHGLQGKESQNPFIKIDFAGMADDLSAKADALGSALTLVTTEVRETQDATGKRNQVRETWTEHYGPVATMAEMIFELVGNKHMAERVRPTLRRRSGTPEPEDLEAQAPASGDDSTGSAGNAGTTTSGGSSGGISGTTGGGGAGSDVPSSTV